MDVIVINGLQETSTEKPQKYKEIKYATLTGYKDTLTCILVVFVGFFMVTAHRHEPKSVTVSRTFPLSFPVHIPLAKQRRHFPIIGQALRWHKCSSKSQPNTDQLK